MMMKQTQKTSTPISANALGAPCPRSTLRRLDAMALEAASRRTSSVPGIAKIDIEGFESDLFATHTDWIAKATALVIEPHDWMLPGKGSSNAFRAAIGPEFEMLISGENLAFVRTAAP